MTLGEKLIRAREQKAWSQGELARRAQVTPAVLSRLETDIQDNPTTKVLRALARTLGVSMDYLAGLYDHDDQAQREKKVAS